MNCEQVRELLSEYLDNVLALEERHRVAAHLQTCHQCSALLADFRRLDALLRLTPRVSPSPVLREKLFSSPEVLALTGPFQTHSPYPAPAIPAKHSHYATTERTPLVALPGGRQSTSPSSSRPTVQAPAAQPHGRRPTWGLRVMHAMIAATLLLTLGVSSLIGWNLWREQTKAVSDPNAITPPASLQQGPIPAGTRFVFRRSGSLWSGATDGSTGVQRLTPANVMVAPNWIVRSPLPGHSAGDLLAYIDQQKGFVHTVRSDGQSDAIIQQPLLKAGVQPSIWNTAQGNAMLSSLAWSRDGKLLAFTADPGGTGLQGLYIATLSTGTIAAVSLSAKGAVSHPVWAPDSIRVAFELVHDTNTAILDYNVQTQHTLVIAAQQHATDTVLTLNWGPAITMPEITWSTGTTEHVHSIQTRRVGIEGMAKVRTLIVGDYAQATYTPTIGSWLLIQFEAGHPQDILRLDLNAQSIQLTHGQSVSTTQWSPDGNYVDYLAAVAASSGTLHILDVRTGTDVTVASKVTVKPVPEWSIDSQLLVYSTSTAIFVTGVIGANSQHALKLAGPATAFAWSATTPQLLVVARSSGQHSLYLVDEQHNTSVQLDGEDIHDQILWTQIP